MSEHAPLQDIMEVGGWSSLSVFRNTPRRYRNELAGRLNRFYETPPFPSTNSPKGDSQNGYTRSHPRSIHETPQQPTNHACQAGIPSGPRAAGA